MSIRQAIVMLGRDQLRSWASMLALSTLEDRPSEMMHLAMTRAKMCELLAEKAGLPLKETFFTVGLFSALDILMERELSDVIKPLPLNDNVVEALLKKQGYWVRHLSVYWLMRSLILRMPDSRIYLLMTYLWLMLKLFPGPIW